MEPELEQLITTVEVGAGDDPVERVAAAAALKDHLDHLGDELLDHFVQDARSHGRSWTQIGAALGVTRQAAQQRHQGLLGRLVDKLRVGGMQRFTPRARTAVLGAQQLARDRGQAEVGSDHLLAAIVTAGDDNLAIRAMERLGVDLDALDRALAEAHPATGERVRGHLPFAGDATATLEGALEAAIELGHNYIGCEHLLLGASRSDGGVASDALAAAGVTDDALIAVVVDLLGGTT